MTQAATEFEIGVDIGGTFTDVVCRDRAGAVRLVKIPTTRKNPSAGVKAAVEYMRREWNVDAGQIARFVHGTTVATNAVLEAKGAKIGLLATEGFKDVIEIGRQMRHAMYDLALKPETPAFLAPGARRKEVRERITASGEVLVPLDEESVVRATEELVAEGVEAIAISFLFSFLNPAHERRAREIILARYPEMMTSLSSEVDPAFREYERTCVTAFDAYIKPVVGRYLENMERDLANDGVSSPLQIMQSRGGISSSSIARQRPVRLFLSGPAAGVIGGLAVGRAAGMEDLITVDIGGTSCDIALISRGRPLIRAEGDISGYAVRVPMVDVNAIGSGGGSIAWIDGAGSLRVGPESAGSEPGPACYGRGGERATVTDASVVLGYINPDYFAAGSLKLVPELARKVIEEKIAGPLGMSLEEAALGIHRVVNAQMAEAIRLVSIGRGIDPRGYALLPLGGGGPLHATALARDLGIRCIVVPPHPGVLSAAGLLFAPIEHEASAAFPRPLQGLAWPEVKRALEALDKSCAELMRREGVPASRTEIVYFADVCYVGQSYHLEIPLQAGAPDPLAALYGDFLAAHDRVYGHSTESPARIVNLRTIHRSSVGQPQAIGALRPNPGEARKGRRDILTAESGRFIAADIFDRAALPIGAGIPGPAVVEQADTTTLIEPGWRGTVAEDGSLVITRD
ncbi:MAG TPA: hydantoinase/oxoprolinase family protein [Alphaproteobacteria bacterium]|nr:hydantoinase/oxoprolinase family protein [Alphaproteobacteria bacterium]